jgi:hypothetical protein
LAMRATAYLLPNKHAQVAASTRTMATIDFEFAPKTTDPKMSPTVKLMFGVARP